eukprot:scaffold38843_cov15-Prasinocladus_malaysianus.AAC.1
MVHQLARVAQRVCGPDGHGSVEGGFVYEAALGAQLMCCFGDQSVPAVGCGGVKCPLGPQVTLVNTCGCLALFCLRRNRNAGNFEWLRSF